MPLPSITPSTASVHRGKTKQFTGSNISSGAFWTVYGTGSIDQNGLYTAPVTGGGPTAAISYHTEAWAYFPPTYFTKNADDSLTKSTGDPAYYGQCVSTATLNSAFDQVEYIAHTDNPYWVGVRNATGSLEFVYSLNGNQIRETHPSGNVVSPSFGIGIGQTMKFRIEPGGHLTIWVADVLKYTSAHVYYTEPLYFMCDAVAPAGTIFMPPKFIGPTIGFTYSHAEATVGVLPEILLPSDGCELYCDPQIMTQADGSSVNTLTDYSGKDRHLSAEAAPAPTFKTNILNGKSVVRFDGTQQPLRRSGTVPIKCGWIVAKYGAAGFPAYPNYKGLLTDYNYQGVLVGSTGDTTWYDFLVPGFEIRTDDRIYAANACPAPMAQFKITFFRYWNGALMSDGLQLGRDRYFADRLWNGDVALVALYSRDFTEEEIRAYTQKLATNFGLSALADVYPYQADVSDTSETSLRTVNTYDPPEGDRIVEVLDAPKRLLNLKFSVAGEAEARAMKKFHRDHYPEVPCIYRDYRFTPPEDIEGYINSPYNLEGSTGDFQYSFTFREK